MAGVYRSREHAERVRAWSRAALERWQLPHQAHVIATSLGRTHVVSAGAGDQICAFLPGTNFCAATSTVVLEALATQFRIYAADLPGQPGLSAEERPRDEVSGYAAWLGDLVTWIHTQHPTARLVLAGHSRGAAVALSADPSSVHGLALLSPAGLIPARPTPAMLVATAPWLVRRDDRGSRRLLEFMSGPAHTPSTHLVEWMTLVARNCHTTGAPAPYPERVVVRWRGQNVRIAVGDHDVFFPPARLRKASRAQLKADPTVMELAGHLLTDEEPAHISHLVAELYSA